jgi:hypothetical protein
LTDIRFSAPSSPERTGDFRPTVLKEVWMAILLFIVQIAQ